MDPRRVDPRRRGGDSATGNDGSGGLLLAGQDAMEVDEALPTAVAPTTGLQTSPTISTATLSRTARANPAAYAGVWYTSIKLPSPFAQHNAPGPTSFRFRNALQRVLAHPETDIEAWSAFLTEVLASYRFLVNDASIANKDTHWAWVESCYGYLLWHFPYAVPYAVRLAHVLWTQSARPGEPSADPTLPPTPTTATSSWDQRAANVAETKLERLLEHLLGFTLDGTPVHDHPRHTSDKGTENETEPSLPDTAFGMCSWSVDLWLLYVRKVQRDVSRGATQSDAKAQRDRIVAAFDLAVRHAGFAVNNHLLWKAYLDYVKGWVHPSMPDQHLVAQEQMMQLRDVYKRLVVLPMTGLDQLWQEYEAFEKSQSEALAAALLQELQPKYQHARNVYLERQRVYSTTDLQVGQRLATPPPDDESDADYSTRLEDDHKLLLLWRQRTSYERINPERLSTNEWHVRIRSTYKEMACTMTRHVEVWHMWSSWQVLVAKKSSAASLDSDQDDGSLWPDEGILQLGQIHIPDSTLLAYAEAELWQRMATGANDDPEVCLRVMEDLLARNPTTLGFVLYQRMVRQLRGVEAARRVFAQARRTLLSQEEYQQTAAKKIADAAVENEGDATNTDGGTGGGIVDTDKAADAANNQGGWMVTNRLEASVGARTVRRQSTSNASNGQGRAQESTPEGTTEVSAALVGPVTWHLFACHAGMEHRINRCPDIAARVYELGLRKHASFLSRPAYVQRYAQLLAELGDTLNLRSLLTKAVAACEQQGNKEALGELWDISLHYESIMAASDPSGMERIREIECKRREALMGPEVEDVGTGNAVGFSEAALVGAQKATIAEQLIRSEGYDTSSLIINGLNRTVDVLGVMGVWGSSSSLSRRGGAASSRDDDLSGSRSDKAFQKRVDYHHMKERGTSADAGFGQDKGLSARERLQQGAGGSGAMTAMMLSIQQMPEWLRPLLLLLPASRLRIPVVAKPPPHLTEMALSTLKQNDLPAERPKDDANKGSKRNASGGDGDSSDEEGGTASSGYSVAFRARQRQRMMSDNPMNGTS